MRPAATARTTWSANAADAPSHTMTGFDRAAMKSVAIMVLSGSSANATRKKVTTTTSRLTVARPRCGPPLQATAA